MLQVEATSMSLTRIISSWSSSNVVAENLLRGSPVDLGTSPRRYVATWAVWRSSSRDGSSRRFEDLPDGRLDARTVERYRCDPVETRPATTGSVFVGALRGLRDRRLVDGNLAASGTIA